MTGGLFLAGSWDAYGGRVYDVFAAVATPFGKAYRHDHDCSKAGCDPVVTDYFF